MSNGANGSSGCAWRGTLSLKGRKSYSGENNRTFNAVKEKVLRGRTRGRGSRLDRGIYIKPKTPLPDAWLALGPVDHLSVHINNKRSRRWCNYCAWRGETDRRSKTTSFKCFVCEWALCYDCFSLFHAETPSFDQSNRFTNTKGRASGGTGKAQLTSVSIGNCTTRPSMASVRTNPGRAPSSHLSCRPWGCGVGGCCDRQPSRWGAYGLLCL